VTGYYYDKQGNPVGPEEAEKFFRDTEYRRIGRETIGDYDVSTVFLVIDHAMFGGPPLLFETMIFQEGSNSDLFMECYHTEEEARAGHEAIVEKLKGGMTPADLHGGEE
jgi:hypothetical protein